MNKLLIIILLPLLFCGCATASLLSDPLRNKLMNENPEIYYASNEELLQQFNTGLDAYRKNPNLKKIDWIDANKTMANIDAGLYTADEAMTVVKGELARRVYNDRIARTQPTLGQRVGAGLLAGLGALPQTLQQGQQPQKTTYQIYDSPYSPVPVGRIEAKQQPQSQKTTYEVYDSPYSPIPVARIEEKSQ